MEKSHKVENIHTIINSKLNITNIDISAGNLVYASSVIKNKYMQLLRLLVLFAVRVMLAGSIKITLKNSITTAPTNAKMYTIYKNIMSVRYAHVPTTSKLRPAKLITR